MATNRTEPEFTTVASQAPARRKSHAGLLVLLFIVGVGLAAGIAYELSQRKTQAQALAAASDTASVRRSRSASATSAIGRL